MGVECIKKVFLIVRFVIGCKCSKYFDRNMNYLFNKSSFENKNYVCFFVKFN